MPCHNGRLCIAHIHPLSPAGAVGCAQLSLRWWTEARGRRCRQSGCPSCSCTCCVRARPAACWSAGQPPRAPGSSACGATTTYFASSWQVGIWRRRACHAFLCCCRSAVPMPHAARHAAAVGLYLSHRSPEPAVAAARTARAAAAARCVCQLAGASRHVAPHRGGVYVCCRWACAHVVVCGTALTPHAWLCRPAGAAQR